METADRVTLIIRIPLVLSTIWTNHKVISKRTNNIGNLRSKKASTRTVVESENYLKICQQPLQSIAGYGFLAT